MGLAWDSTGIAFNVQLWREAYRVIKPGGHLLAFGGTRTYHRMVCAIEDAGFEIRDQIDWLYGSGFPKSLDVSKVIDKAAGVKREDALAGGHMGYSRGAGDLSNSNELGTSVLHCIGKGAQTKGTPSTPEAQQWDGWGTALKPAHEPICLARKPLSEPTVAENVLKWGTGALNIDACRIEGVKPDMRPILSEARNNPILHTKSATSTGRVSTQGRWPANCLFDEDAAALLDLQSGTSCHKRNGNRKGGIWNSDGHGGTISAPGDSGGASRFFQVIKDDLAPFIYMPKASKSERNLGIPKIYDLDPDTPPDAVSRIKTLLEAME
jgi:site-specific DNA-methyltransferase (adenine-specific)